MKPYVYHIYHKVTRGKNKITTFEKRRECFYGLISSLMYIKNHDNQRVIMMMSLENSPAPSFSKISLRSRSASPLLRSALFPNRKS